MVAAGIVISILFILPLRWFDPITSAFMLRDDSGRVPPMQIWVDWERLGSSAPLAAVASEDQRFAEHLGIDIQSIQKSIKAAEGGARLRGASTITQQLTNWTREDHVMRRTLKVGIAHGSNVEHVIEVINEILVKHDKVLRDPPHRIWFFGFDEYGLSIVIWLFTELDDGFATVSNVYTQLHERFRKEGIEISVPKREITMRAVEAELSTVDLQGMTQQPPPQSMKPNPSSPTQETPLDDPKS